MKNQRILNQIEKIGTRKQRKREGHSDNFIRMFNFYIDCYRSGIIGFSGSNINVKYSNKAKDAMVVFKEYDNGLHSNKSIIYTKQPNLLYACIFSKKGWGLLVNQWAEGIVEGSFTKYEFLKMFDDANITIPKPLLLDFNNRVWSYRFKYWKKEKEKNQFYLDLYSNELNI